MPARQDNKISQQNQHSELCLSSVPPSPCFSNSSNLNLHDQAFILYSDDQILSNSNSSSVPLSRARSNISSHSSFSDLGEKYHRDILAGLSHSNEESSIVELNASECSDSGLQLIKGLEPLLQSRNFLRRSPRFAIHDVNNKKDEKLQPVFTTVRQGNKNSIEQQIQDQKPVFNINNEQPNQSSRILQQGNQTFFGGAFQKQSDEQIQIKQVALSKNYEATQLMCLTRSTKKLLQYETQSSNSNNNRREGQQLQNITRGPMTTNDYVSQLTKQHILASRKEKRIKKAQQKQFQHGLRAFRNDSKIFNRN